MPSLTYRYGNLTYATIAGIIAIPFFLSIPTIGLYLVLFAGIFCGLIARGVVRGIAASAVAGFVVAVVVISLSAVNGYNFVYNDIYSNVLFSSLLSSGALVLLQALSLDITKLVILTMIYTVAIPVFGGFLGGAMRPGY